MKKAILLVSFGTTHVGTRQKTIDALYRDIETAYLDFDVYQAFTSKIVRERIEKNEGIVYDNPGDKLQQLIDQGYKEIYIQSSHIVNGSEFGKIYMYLKRFKDQDVKIRVGRPLLNTKDDFDYVINHLKHRFNDLQPNEAVLFMAHGTDSNAFTSYVTLSYMLQNSPIYVACVEGYPDFDGVIDQLKQDGVESIRLYPLMLVAGDHAANDMASDEEDSWKSQLQRAGFKVEAVVEGLGEDPSIRAHYLEHLKTIIEKKSRCHHAR